MKKCIKNSVIMGMGTGCIWLSVLISCSILGVQSILISTALLFALFSISVLIRLQVEQKYLLMIELFFLTVASLGINTILPKLVTGKFYLSIKIYFLLFIMSIIFEGLIRISNPPKLLLRKFNFKQLIVIFIGGTLNYFMLVAFSSIHSNYKEVIFIFFGTMTFLFFVFLVDEFGVMTLIALVFGIFFINTDHYNLIDLVLASKTKVEIAVLIIATAFLIECILQIASMKNIMFVFKSVRYGHINNAYRKVMGSLSIAMIFAVIVTSVIHLMLMRNELNYQVIIGFVICLFGGISAAILSNGIKEWGLYNIINGSYKQKWFKEYDKWLTCCAIADIDGDGRNEVIVGCADRNVYCYKDDREIWRYNVNNVPSPTCGIGTLGDEEDIKIVVGSYDGKLRCLNAAGELVWANETLGWIWSVALGDVDNDGENEVVYGGMDNYIHVCKNGGDEMWSVEFDNWIGCCAIGDADNDGQNEVVAGSSDNTLRCFKNGPNEVWRAHFGEWVNGCAIGDIDGDGLNEVVAGGFDGTLRCYRNGEELWRVIIHGTIGALAIGDVDGDGLNEIVVGCGDHTIRVYKNGKQVWIGRVEKYPDGIAIGDIDNDGKNEFITGDWYCYLRCFKKN